MAWPPAADPNHTAHDSCCCRWEQWPRLVQLPCTSNAERPSTDWRRGLTNEDAAVHTAGDLHF